VKHLDLFSGIGGFSLACDWLGIETICFCEIDKFCQKVLREHWPDVPIVEDVNNVEEIRGIVENALKSRARSYSEAIANQRGRTCQDRREGIRQGDRATSTGRIDTADKLLLTAGFPCQPFSAAGRRKGSADSRYLWPQTLAVIEAVKPDWVLLENVAGILSMVFPDSKTEMENQTSLFNDKIDKIKQITIYPTIIGRILDNLKEAGYEVAPPLVIPACAVNAPHRRDRVWIVAHSIGNLGQSRLPQQEQRGMADKNQQKISNVANALNGEHRGGRGQIREADSIQSECRETLGSRLPCRTDRDVANSTEQGLQGAISERSISGGCLAECNNIPGWSENWYEVATRFCGVDDGIPNRVDRLKALGNAIVPQVAYQIIKAIVGTGSVLPL